MYETFDIDGKKIALGSADGDFHDALGIVAFVRHFSHDHRQPFVLLFLTLPARREAAEERHLPDLAFGCRRRSRLRSCDRRVGADGVRRLGLRLRATGKDDGREQRSGSSE